jgi:hypothetical protein
VVRRPWAEVALYELHAGAFTVDGNLSGVAVKLDDRGEFGVIAIELMSVAPESPRQKCLISARTSAGLPERACRNACAQPCLIDRSISPKTSVVISFGTATLSVLGIGHDRHAEPCHLPWILA